MKKIILTTILTLNFSYAFADRVDETSLLLQEEFSQTQPDRYNKYILETKDLKILVFKINYQEPPLNPLFFNVYFQCKSNQVFFKLDRVFNNSEEESNSYCGHNNFHIGTIEGKGRKQFLILPMKRDTNHVCPNQANNFEIFPIDEMKKNCLH